MPVLLARTFAHHYSRGSPNILPSLRLRAGVGGKEPDPSKLSNQVQSIIHPKAQALSVLSLEGLSWKDSDLSPVANLKELRSIGFYNCSSITGECLKFILPDQIEPINFSVKDCPSFMPDNLGYLKDRIVWVLTLDNVPLTKETLGIIGAVPGISQIHLNRVPVNAEDVVESLNQPSLGFITLNVLQRQTDEQAHESAVVLREWCAKKPGRSVMYMYTTPDGRISGLSLFAERQPTVNN